MKQRIHRAHRGGLHRAHAKYNLHTLSSSIVRVFPAPPCAYVVAGWQRAEVTSLRAVNAYSWQRNEDWNEDWDRLEVQPPGIDEMPHWDR